MSSLSVCVVGSVAVLSAEALAALGLLVSLAWDLLALWALTVSLRLWATARAIDAMVFAARPSAWHLPISRPFSGLSMLLTVSTRLRLPYAVCHAGVPYGTIW